MDSPIYCEGDHLAVSAEKHLPSPLCAVSPPDTLLSLEKVHKVQISEDVMIEIAKSNGPSWSVEYSDKSKLKR